MARPIYMLAFFLFFAAKTLHGQAPIDVGVSGVFYSGNGCTTPPGFALILIELYNNGPSVLLPGDAGISVNIGGANAGFIGNINPFFLFPGDTTIFGVGGMDLPDTGFTIFDVFISHNDEVDFSNNFGGTAAFIKQSPTAAISTMYGSGSNITLTASGGAGYLWNTADTTAIISVNPSFPTQYAVTVTHSSGCTHSAGVSLLPSNYISSMEYFMDTDPGVGNGFNLNIVPGATIDTSFSLSSIGLNAGFHRLYTRARFANGRWGLAEASMFYLFELPVLLDEDIDALEYFFDTDPGTGNGEPIALTAGMSVSAAISIPVGALGSGFHRLYSRARNAEGRWGLAEASMFYLQPVSAFGSPQNIMAAEVFFDSFPAVGEGTPVPVGPSLSLDTTLLVEVPQLPSGEHNLFIRIQTEDGAWSLAGQDTFEVMSNLFLDAGLFGMFPLSNLCPSPNFEMGVTLSNDGNEVIPAGSALVTLDMSGANTGNLSLFNPGDLFPGQFIDLIFPMNAINPGLTNFDASVILPGDVNNQNDFTSASFTLQPLPNVSISGNLSLCTNSSTTLTASGGNTYIWSNGASTPSITVSPAANTVYAVTATSTTGCTATASAQVTVGDNPPTAVCQPASVFLDNNGLAFISEILIDAGSFDDCTPFNALQLAVSPNVFTCAGLGINVVTLTVTDAAGNIGTCLSTVTVLDGQAPVLACISVSTTLNASGQAAVSLSDISPAVTDNCGVDSLYSSSSLNFNCSLIGLNAVMVTAVDNSGNTSVCNTTVTVSDLSPVLTCPASITVLYPPALTSVAIENIAPEVSFCVNLSYQLVGATSAPQTPGNASGQVFNNGNTTVIYRATNANGSLLSQCTFTVTLTHLQTATDVPIDPAFDDCVSFDGDLETASISAPFPDCANVNDWRKDTWYQFQPNNAPLFVRVAASPDMTAVIEVHSVSGNTIVLEGCAEATQPGGIVTFGPLNLPVGPVYYARVYSKELNPATTWFTFYVFENDCPLKFVIPESGEHKAEKEYADTLGWTHYIKDDSLLLLSVKREGRFIGAVGDPDFNVFINRSLETIWLTDPNLPTPAYIVNPQENWVALNSYWKVDVNPDNIDPGNNSFKLMTYFTLNEFETLRDLDFPLIMVEQPEDLLLYKINSRNDAGELLNPDPSLFHEGVQPNDISLFTIDGAGGTGQWSLALLGDTEVQGFIGIIDMIAFSGGGIMGRGNPTPANDPTGAFKAMKVSPVPTADLLYVETDERLKGDGVFTLYDCLGKSIHPARTQLEKTSPGCFMLDVGELPSGIYFIQYAGEGFHYGVKFIKS